MSQQTHVVIIDDDQDACELLKMQLEDTGRMHVTFHTNGDDAIDVISRELPDVAILDINMPGTHGVAIGSALSENAVTADIPILYLSGMVTPGEAQSMGKGDDTSPLISKGSPIEKLIAAIDSSITV